MRLRDSQGLDRRNQTRWTAGVPAQSCADRTRIRRPGRRAQGLGPDQLLTVAVNRLQRWHRPGLLCIGDAAHAMSPIGGVGVNLAVQDAVAAANILWQPLKAGTLREDDLDRVERRREFPTRVTQRIQVVVQNNVIDRLLGAGEALAAPLPLRLTSWFAP